MNNQNYVYVSIIKSFFFKSSCILNKKYIQKKLRNLKNFHDMNIIIKTRKLILENMNF